ncbi:MAG: D-aminoacylase [Thermoplasmata archaeon]
MNDIIIKNGIIIDGTGNDWIKSDLAIKNGIISKIGNLSAEKADEYIDASKKIVCPGFIDIHSHSDFTALIYPTSDSKILQGVTTEVVGNCGSSPAPLTKENIDFFKADENLSDLSWDWGTLDQYYSKIMKIGTSVNYVPLVGHGTLRSAVMGFERREPSDTELRKMKNMLEHEMKSGYFGVSTGLEYAPGSFSNTNELVELSKVASKYSGIYTSHIRDEGPKVLEAVSEVIEIGKRAKIPVEISHLKVVGRENWNKDDALLQLILKARSEGIEVNADIYPYTASETTLSIFLPSWAMEGGNQMTLKRLKNKKIAEKIKKDLKLNAEDEMNVAIPSYDGKTIKDLSQEWHLNSFDVFCRLLLDNKGKVSMIHYCMKEESIEKFLALPLVSICSDQNGIKPGYGRLGGWQHPRAYGTFPRVISRYWREKNILSLPEAIRKMTGLPATKMRLKKRGLIKEYFYADIVVFDPEKISDTATFIEPAKFPIGINYVIVNGNVTAKNGIHTGSKRGIVIKRFID